MTADLRTARTWNAQRKRALKPLHCSAFRTTQRDRDEFLTGAALLRFHGEHARPGHAVVPQQLQLVDVLAAGNPRNAVLLPRRSSKSTTLIAIGLGRAEAREDYRVGYLALTSGKAGRSRFLKDVAPALDRIGATHGDDKRNWPFKIVRSAGQERVEFVASGGSVSWLSSIDDLRGESFDLIILDEGQAAEVEKAREVIAAALPTLDTRPHAQIVVAGTATSWTIGNLLAEWLEHGRTGDWGILEHAADPDTPDDLLEAWETVAPLVLAAHPGVGTLTSLAAVKGNYEAMTRAQFAAEYLGLWGAVGAGRTAINPKAWLDAGVDDSPAVPEHFTMACMPSFTGRSAAIVAAWRDEDGNAHGYVLDHRPGTTWVADSVATFARRHDLPIVFDKKSSDMRVEVEALQRMDPSPRLAPRDWQDVTAAAALLVKDINHGNAVHYRQPALEEAAKVAVRRSAGPTTWALGRPPENKDADIAALEAWALALHYYDDNPPQAFIAPIMAA